MHDHHHHGPTDYNRAFAVGVGLNVAYILLEAGAGLYVNSLALLADAGHNLSDVLGLLLAWGAHVVARVKPTDRLTYGWRSTSILAALANGLILLVVTGGIAWEAIQRFGAPNPVPGTIVIWIAAIGVLINGVTAMFFFHGGQQDLNIRGAYLHMAADAAVSLGVVVAGIGMLYGGWLWLDPLISLVVAVIIFLGTWGLFRESLSLAMHAVPKGIELSEVRAFLEDLPGVEVVHDLHVWAMSTTEPALTAHLVKPDVADEDEFLFNASHELHKRFGIEHVTLQIERDVDSPMCQQAHPDAV